MSSVTTETQIKHKIFKLPPKIPNEVPIVAEKQKEISIEKYEVNNNEEVEKKDKVEYKRKIVWFNAIGFLVLHIAAVYALYLSVTSAKMLTNIWGKFKINALNFSKISKNLLLVECIIDSPLYFKEM